MALVSINQIIDKTLIAAKTVYVFSRASADKQYYLYKVNAGDDIGKVYSWVTDKNGATWLQLYGKKNNYGEFVVFTKDSFSLSALKEQGAKTVEEQIKEKEDENKSWYEKLSENVGSFIPKAAIAVGAFILLRDIVKAKVK